MKQEDLKNVKDAMLEKGDVVQIGPTCGNPVFAHHLMIVTNPKPWGAQGYVVVLDANGSRRHAFFRCNWKDFEYVGKATWVFEWTFTDQENPI